MVGRGNRASGNYFGTVYTLGQVGTEITIEGMMKENLSKFDFK
jgi:hypothetical protein